LLRIEINNTKVELLEANNISIQGCSAHEKIIDILKENKEKAI